MTFEEWFKQPREYNLEVYDVAKEAWEARVPEGYVLVPIEPSEDYWEEVLRKKYLKAAIPEGYVLVPIFPTMKTLSMIEKLLELSEKLKLTEPSVYHCIIASAQEDNDAS